MKRITTLLLMASLFFASKAQNAKDLFISEYCEYNQTVTNPQYFNHYIEIYNGTGAPVDMTKYQLWRSMNATGWNVNNGTPVTPLTLKGTLENNKTYVITRPNTNTNPISISSDSAQSWSFLNISGDDAIGLAKDDGTGNFVLIDIIGSETTDPGESWTVAGVAGATMNHTMVRKSSVCEPSLDWTKACGTSTDDSEWTVLSQNDISNINQHTCNCNGIPSDTIPTDTIPVTPIDTNHYKYTALFIGNSYTYYNDLPTLIDSLARTTGDTLIKYSSTPGGYYLDQHYSLLATQTLLKARAYDYVVLQEQSQRPALDSVKDAYKFFKYAIMLDSIRRIYSPCGQTMYYMTWGRKFGDSNNCATNPNVCTYEGMDSMLNLRYRMAQQQTDALISPVGAVRNYLRKNNPEIELYESDNSHPSPAGSFVSAVTFYTCMFKKDPTYTTYNFSVGAEVSKKIKDAVKKIVFDTLSFWNNYKSGADTTIKISISAPQKSDTVILSKPFSVDIAIDSKENISKVTVFLNGKEVKTSDAAPAKFDLTTTVKGSNNIIVTVKNAQGGINFKRVDFKSKEALINSVNHLEGEKLFNLYPNPVPDILTIEMLQPEKASYEIYYLTGQVLRNGIIENGRENISMIGLKPGIYTIKITSTNAVNTEKLVKK